MKKAAFGLFEKVYKITKKIPKGKVASYGQVAAMMGNVRMARFVGWALHQLLFDTKGIPWQRVINSKGYISTTCLEHTREEQRMLLEKDGVEITEKDGLYWIDLKKYLWMPYK